MKEGDELARLPYLREWFRTRHAIVLHLSNGSLQVKSLSVAKNVSCDTLFFVRTIL